MIGLWNVGYAQNIAALKKDPDVIIIKKAIEKLKSHDYKMPPNMNMLQVEMAKNPSPENMKIILKKNGMADADAFVDIITLQRNAMLHFNQKHPELMKLEPVKRLEVMRKVMEN